MKNLILALSILFAITIFNPQIYSQKRDNQQPKNLRMNLKAQLNLSEDQEKKIDVLRLSHEENLIKLNSELDFKNLDMKKLLSSDNITRVEMINLTKGLSGIKNDIALARANHQMDVYDLLDSAQRKIWMEKMEKSGDMKKEMKDKMHKRRK
ncbi:MAG: hypothetical protein ABI638_02820 [Ignavibacteriota bacterium]